MTKVLPWSYSALQQYETCPRRYFLTRVAKKVKEPMTPATLEGNAVHKALELAVKGTNGLLPKYAGYQPIVDKFRAIPGVQTERNFALTKNFTTTGYWDGDAWVRGKADVSFIAGERGFIFDYKTGKVKEDSDQLNLFAAVMLAEQPNLKLVHTAYLWVAHDKLDQQIVEREQAPMIWQGFVGRVSAMERSAEMNDFPPRPSGLCKEWCPVGKSNCEHCGKA